MRALVAVLLLGCLVAIGFLFWPPSVVVPPPGGEGPGQSGDPQGDGPGSTKPPSTAATNPGALPPNTVATRTAAPDPGNEPLAAEPTAWLRVVDQSTGSPVPGAAVRASQSGLELAFTDEQGLAALPLLQPAQLALVADHYLLRLVPANLDSSEKAPQEVRLVRDRWSSRVRVLLRGAGGAAVNEAFVWCEPVGELVALTPDANEPVVARAWREHTMLTRLPALQDVGYEDGDATQPRVHRVAHEGSLRFVASGSFRLVAATVDGRVGATTVTVPNGGSVRAEIPLASAPALTGVVVDAAGAPLAGATVRLERGDPLGLVATTGANGAFALAPLHERSERLHVQHPDHLPMAFGPVSTRSRDLRIALEALPSSAIRGRVRSRPHGEALAGATVLWSPAGGRPITTETDAAGRFTLLASGNQPARLFVQARLHVPYAELVAPGAAFADYDLLPAVPTTRAARGLSALLCGAVVDARGQPLAGAIVRWVPDRTELPPELPSGRRSLEGAVLELNNLVTTALDGSFALETRHFGSGRLCLPEDVGNPARGLRVEAIAGQTQNGLTLRR